MKKLVSAVLALLLAVCCVAPGLAEGTRTYYYVAPYQSIPYCIDMHYGFEYAVNKLGGQVEIVCVGPDDGDSDAAAEALEQVIAKNPDGIITANWDNNMNAAVEKARAAGIPVVCVEACADIEYDMYIGLDNFATGEETAEALVKYAGESGKLLAIGNWGSTNIDDEAGTFTTSKGDTYSFSKVDTLNATAYTARPGAICSTGRVARVGVVAVDPKYIPYGTEMFIMSEDGSFVYGLAIAGDCGGAIDNNDVDLYMNSRNNCIQFGRRNLTAFIIESED